MSVMKDLSIGESATEFNLNSTSLDNVNQDTAGFNIAESSSGNPDPTDKPNLNISDHVAPSEHPDLSAESPVERDGVSGSFSISGSRDSEPEPSLSIAPSPNNVDHSSQTPVISRQRNGCSTPGSLALSRNRQDVRVPEAGSSSFSRQVNTNPSNDHLVQTPYYIYHETIYIPWHFESSQPTWFCMWVYVPHFPLTTNSNFSQQPRTHIPSIGINGVDWWHAVSGAYNPNHYLAAHQQSTSQYSWWYLVYQDAQTRYIYLAPFLYHNIFGYAYFWQWLPGPEEQPPLEVLEYQTYLNDQTTPEDSDLFELEDIYSGMRLDIDDMNYEELLQLEENIGSINTGVEKERIMKLMKRRAYCKPECCICKEEYVCGEQIGTLDCKHEFHASCIEQWLVFKNQCPICKRKGLGS